ncbi:hypothetical protein XF_2581 [Xylella fastidiosa 9a5c]|uniref:Uncharacterized protein n=1 Tax=Xylella fastidiosa (strain 9a5c) TaxID=160492 RepID=Q9PAD7_XYLFA|nr:hypothetical protein XF_2581 [Xylella fastidiosa 9a5c]
METRPQAGFFFRASKIRESRNCQMNAATSSFRGIPLFQVNTSDRADGYSAIYWQSSLLPNDRTESALRFQLQWQLLTTPFTLKQSNAKDPPTHALPTGPAPYIENLAKQHHPPPAQPVGNSHACLHHTSPTAYNV